MAPYRTILNWCIPILPFGVFIYGDWVWQRVSCKRISIWCFRTPERFGGLGPSHIPSSTTSSFSFTRIYRYQLYGWKHLSSFCILVSLCNLLWVRSRLRISIQSDPLGETPNRESTTEFTRVTQRIGGLVRGM